MDYEKVYAKLNTAQKEAVDTIDGPLLVVAGPGTGKTQLLSARVAHILNITDTLPQNILCLTFTESGAANMRERLTQFIGKEAYDVNISTYHALGGDIIRRFSQYFEDERLEQPIDTLGKHQIVESIIHELGYRDPLKQTRHHLKDLIATISEIKRALLTPYDLRTLAAENQIFLDTINRQLLDILTDFDKMPRNLENALIYFEGILSSARVLIPKKPVNQQFGSLAEIAVLELETAITEAQSLGKTNPLTKWKNKWLEKDADNHFILSGGIENRRLASLADVLEKYQTRLSEGGFFDFDDMIIRAISALETNLDLRYTLQEQYLYILLDEYQDTNAAQAKLVQLLTDNPVNEGRPNVMAVGDDDQAIYAFQGAQYSNMLDFFGHYTNTRLINLSENYRSHGDILHTAKNIAEQIDARLFHQFPGTSKTLTASNTSIASAHIERREFQSSIAENAHVAASIKKLIGSGVSPNEIAVLTPKHGILESFVPYASQLDIPVRYEKRENILETKTIKQLLTMSRLVLHLADNKPDSEELWPEMLSYDFFKIPVSDIWKLSWQVVDSNRQADTKTGWTRQMLESDNLQLRTIARLFLALAARAKTESCELMLDYLIGTAPVSTNEADEPEITSPMRGYLASSNDQNLYDALSHLTVLQSKLRDYQKTVDQQATLVDLLQLVDNYKSAGERMLNTNPYNQSAESVQLMTVFKAKGLEFEHVFLLSVSDEVWGGSGQSASNKLTLPKNLAPTRHSGATEDERLRLFFVAITRAKSSLYLTSSLQNYSGKATKRLKYLDEREESDGSFAAYSLPETKQTVHSDDTAGPDINSLETNWRARHMPLYPAELKDLLRGRLDNYQLSPTHLNSFFDLKYGGPSKFLFNTLLRFPSAPGIDGQFGNSVHYTLKWVQNQLNLTGSMPPLDSTLNYFKQNIALLKLSAHDTSQLTERGEVALTSYLSQRRQTFARNDKAEVDFRREGVLVGDAHLTGIIDKLEINLEDKYIVVVDYKTGTQSSEKNLKYARQLYCYKILIENSHSFKGYEVGEGRLEYVEPNQEGVVEFKSVKFTQKDLETTKQLIEIMWTKVQSLDFPDTSSYSADSAGSKQFMLDMLSL